MALISSSIPNFVNGVSQQPFTLRLISQGEVQENGLSTVSQGLKKRPPTKHLKKIQSTPLGNCFIHTINRDLSERYITVLTNGDLKVYNINGVEQTVNFPNGKGYLNAATPSTAFSAVTVADYTFIVNKNTTVTASSSLTATRPFEALINIKAGNYGKTYNVYINGALQAQYVTPTGATPTDVNLISTDHIAGELYNDLVAGGFTAGNWAVYKVGSIIYVRNTVTDFSITTEDGFNSAGMVAIKGRLQKFADLPANAYENGFIVEISGTGAGETATQPFDSYFVRYETVNTTGVGVWKETAAPGISLGMNAATMPHILVRESNGTFTFKQATYKNRIVGNNESNPLPSFIGRTIADVFFYRNRLGLLSDEAIIFSEAGEYFNLMRTTVTQLLDSDPIDVNASHTKVAVLKHAVPFNKQLLLFSEQTQFLIDQGDILSPKSIGIKVATEFPCNVIAKPLGIGKNVYFAVDKGSNSSFREYFTDLNNQANDAIEITAHVPQYIASNIYKIAAAVNEDIMVALSTADPSNLYIYKYFFNANEKLQSSWSKWSYGSDSTILNVDFIGSDMYLVINRADGVFLEKTTVSLGDTGPNEPYNVHLDRKVQLGSSDVSFSAGFTNINLTNLGYTPSTGTYQLVVRTHPTLKPGEIMNVIWDGTNAKVAGNITGGTYTFGRRYVFSYQLSTVVVRTPTAGGGQKADTEGRLQLRKLAFNYDDAGYFKVRVTPAGRETYSYVFSGKVLGQSSGTIGSYSISEGRFVVPIISQNIGTNITLENDSPLPSSFLSADWEGFYTKRSKAI
ncbi:hypothetical protein UFOVP348_43 [uncultured Caudovirales phage]|uniref:Tail tubular protein B n=1 Tax=uncultured Caudovirales phage TaxID=2100421 RepID=A0A6J5M5T2_9CAUD|nr:hypothetical protein UFOVP348_43 [uncultured Caudovirales phage]